jgi:LysR family transcriptional regulator, low CO2-responsive transcriptional regulator
MDTDRPAGAITLQQLRVFAAAARHGSFARAADALNLSEPNVSTHIQALERALNATLFARSRGRRQVHLTEAGAILLETSSDIFEALERGLRSLEHMREAERSRVRVGVGVYFGGYLMPRLQDRFRRAHPEVALRVEVFNEPVAASERVIQGHLDLLVVGDAIQHPALVSEPFPGFDCVLVAAPGHQLAGRRGVPFRELRHEPMVVRVRSAPSWRALEQLAARHGFSFEVALESPDMDSEVQAVSSGVGLAAMPWETVAPRIAAGQLAVLDVEGLPIHAQRYLVSRRGTLPEAVVALKAVLRDSTDLLTAGIVPANALTGQAAAIARRRDLI